MFASLIFFNFVHRKKGLNEISQEDEELQFQLQIYETCEENICLLIKKTFDYLCNVKHVLQPTDENTNGPRGGQNNASG